MKSVLTVLLLAVSCSQGFPQRPLSSYASQQSAMSNFAPMEYYLVPMQADPRMASYNQFGMGQAQPQIFMLNPASFGQYNPYSNQNQYQYQYQSPAESRSDTQPQEPLIDQVKDDQSQKIMAPVDRNQGPSMRTLPSQGPIFLLVNPNSQMGYYDTMAASRMDDRGPEPLPYAGFRPASHYQRARSQKPLVGLSYAYPNLFTRQQSYDGYEDGDGVVVEAGPGGPNMRYAQAQAEKGERVDSENVEAAEPAGPSVAQSKPQAIAMAGPGGVAAATPMATAVVGPGGMAVAAPSATAVAGPSGGRPPMVAGTGAAISAAHKAQQKAERKQEHFSAVSLGGKLVAPLGSRHSDGLLAFAV